MSSVSEERVRRQYEILGEELAERGVDVGRVKRALMEFEVEVPSWVFGRFGGGRFGDYMPPAPAPDGFAKIRDAAFVHKLTGAAPRAGEGPGCCVRAQVDGRRPPGGHSRGVGQA